MADNITRNARNHQDQFKFGERLLEIDERAVNVNFQKRAHNPLLVAAVFDETDIRIPWLGKRLRFLFG